MEAMPKTGLATVALDKVFSSIKDWFTNPGAVTAGMTTRTASAVKQIPDPETGIVETGQMQIANQGTKISSGIGDFFKNVLGGISSGATQGFIGPLIIIAILILGFVFITKPKIKLG